MKYIYSIGGIASAIEMFFGFMNKDTNMILMGGFLLIAHQQFFIREIAGEKEGTK